MNGERTSADLLWIAMVALFLIPVFIYSSGSRGDAAEVTQGPLLVGRSSLDSLLSESLGRPVLINFWATWCTPCVGELPHLDAIYSSMEGSVTVVAVDVGDPRLETLLDFRDGVKLAMPVVWLNGEEAEELKSQWQLPDLLPVSVFLDARGNETGRVAGVREEEFFLQALQGDIPAADTVPEPAEEAELHINVVGAVADSMTLPLLDASTGLAGSGGVDHFDPSIPADSIEMVELNLPFTGYTYAQPCIGSACGRPARTPEELLQTVEALRE